MQRNTFVALAILFISLFLHISCGQENIDSLLMERTQDFETKDTTSSETEQSTALVTKQEQNIGRHQVTVKFNCGSGRFHMPSGLITANIIEQPVNVGDKLQKPDTIPYLEGARFLGYYRYYSEDLSGISPWDFEKDVVTENDRWGLTLWAFFEENSDNPDGHPPYTQPATDGHGSSSDSIHRTDSRYPPVDLSHKLQEGETLTLFAKGVDVNNGWFNEPQYANNCWATAAAQVIYWYQKNLTHVGFADTEHPIGLLGDGNKSVKDEKQAITELRDYFLDKVGQRGYDVTPAMSSYFNECLSSDRWNDWTTYSSGGVGTPYSLETLSGILYRHLEKGDMCAFEGWQGGLHAMNIYGAEFDRNGIIKTLYATSSPTYDTKELVDNHAPNLLHATPYYSNKSGTLGWTAVYEVRGDNYISSQQETFDKIYELHFLSVSRYE